MAAFITYKFLSEVDEDSLEEQEAVCSESDAGSKDAEGLTLLDLCLATAL